MADNYYKDIFFRIVAHRFKIYGGTRQDKAESNSLEFIRSGKIYLEREDGTLTELKAPALFWIREGERFRYTFEGEHSPGNATEHIYADFIGSRTDRMMETLDTLCPGRVLTPHEPERVSDLFFRLLELYRSGKEKNHAEMVAVIEMIMALAFNAAFCEKNAADHDGLERTAEMFRREPFKDYDFRKIARDEGFSEDHFRRIFRKRHQLTPKEYLLHQRMLRAAELLENTDMRINEIVYSCRFSSDVDFSRSFKKYSGLSPRAYREQVRQGTSPQIKAI